MGRTFLVGASTLLVLGLIACGNSNDTGSGTPDSGGPPGAGGTRGVSPGKASIDFTVAGPSSYCMSSQCGEGPSVGIKDSSGKALVLTTSCTDVSCATCAASPCPGFACEPMGIAVTGAKLEWDGTVYATSTCGTGTSCVEPTFAKPGKYTATLCATPGELTGPDGGTPQCVASAPMKCGTVEFDLPSGTPVKGMVGP